MWGNIAIAFILAFVVTLVTTPYTMKIANKIGAIDIPKDERRAHKKTIPKFGGPAVILGFLVSTIYLLIVMSAEKSINLFDTQEYWKKLLGFLLGIIIISIFCVVDDIKTIRPIVKLLGQILGAICVAFSGIKIGGTAFVTSILAGQLSKAGLNSALVGSSEAVAKLMGPKASAVIINAFRGSANAIYGGAAMKSFAKLLRGNTITAVITVGVFSTFDIVDIFRKRISGKQLFKNITSTATSTVGGIGGFIAGQSIIPIPVVGGLIGSVIVASAVNTATNSIMGHFMEDDAEEMVRIIEKVFAELANEYLLNQKEAEKSVDKLKTILDGNKLKEMFASSDRKKFAKEMLIPIIENEISIRKKIYLPTNESMLYAVRELLEKTYDFEMDTV